MELDGVYLGQVHRDEWCLFWLLPCDVLYRCMDLMFGCHFSVENKLKHHSFPFLPSPHHCVCICIHVPPPPHIYIHGSGSNSLCNMHILRDRVNAHPGQTGPGQTQREGTLVSGALHNFCILLPIQVPYPSHRTFRLPPGYLQLFSNPLLPCKDPLRHGPAPLFLTQNVPILGPVPTKSQCPLSLLLFSP